MSYKAKCDVCGGKADFGCDNPELGLEFTNYCHDCFAREHPDAVELKNESLEILTDALFDYASLPSSQARTIH